MQSYNHNLTKSCGFFTAEKRLIGVNLLGGNGSLQTNLGVVLLEQDVCLSVSDLRTQICKQLISCPADYTICSKQG